MTDSCSWPEVSCAVTFKMVVALNLALTVFILFYAKKPTFASANSVCYSFHMDEVTDIKDLRITPSLWVYNLCILCILLILAGDIETCPGPKCCVNL